MCSSCMFQCTRLTPGAAAFILHVAGTPRHWLSLQMATPPPLHARQPYCQLHRPACVEDALAAQAARMETPEKRKADALASVSGFAFHIQDAIRNTPAAAVSRSRIVDRYAVRSMAWDSKSSDWHTERLKHHPGTAVILVLSE